MGATDLRVELHPNAAWLRVLSSALMAVALSFHATAQGQSRALAAYDSGPAPDDDSFITIRGSITPGHLRTNFTLAETLTLGTLQLTDPTTGQESQPVSLRLQTDLVAQLGLGRRAAVSAEVPVINYQHGDAFMGRPQLAKTAFGDPRVRARYRLFGAVATPEGGRADGPGLALEATGYIPAGYNSAFAGDRAFRGELTALADFQLLGAGAGAHLGVRHRFGPHTVADLRLRDAMTYGVAFKLPMTFWPALTALLELNGSTEFDGFDKSPLELLLGARIHVEEWTVLLHGGVGLAGGVGGPDGIVSLGLRYSPAISDTDGDGIADDEDACPFLPEDRDGFEDGDGCEDPDNDNDLIPDVDDLCPNDEALEGQDADEDGCTD